MELSIIVVDDPLYMYTGEAVSSGGLCSERADRPTDRLGGQGTPRCGYGYYYTYLHS